MTELVGEGKPFHSAVDKAAGMLKRKVGTGAEFMKELMGVTGIKPTELQERGLTEIMGMPRMTHDQFMAALGSKPAPAIQEKVLKKYSPEELTELTQQKIRKQALQELSQEGYTESQIERKLADRIDELELSHDYDDVRTAAHRELSIDKSPHHEKWTLPGGENYREMLIKAPQPQGHSEKLMELKAKLRRAPPDQVAHYQTLIDKYQKLASQDEQFPGNPSHFGGEPGILASMRLKDRKGPNGEKLLHLEELQSDWHQQGREHGYDNVKPIKTTNPDGTVTVDFGNNQKTTFQNDLYADDAIHTATIKNKKSVPDAPFKKNWEEMAIKRLIHHAAEKGYHGIVVTPGAEQADRYNLAQHVDEISHYPRTDARTGEKSKSVRIDMKTGNPVQLGVNQEGIVDNISNSEHENFKGKHISDIVGKEHAKNIMGNERGQISGEGLTVGGEGMKGFYDKKVPNIFNAVGKRHGVKMQLHGHTIEKEPANRLQVGEMTYEDPAKLAQLHHFPITEPMRQDVLKNGLPLYNTGGVIHKAEGGNVQPSVEQMRMALQNKGTFPKYDIQSIGANEAPSMSPKYYIEPGNDGHPSVGGVDMNKLKPGMQLVQQDAQAMQPPQGAPQGGNNSSPLGAPPSPQGGQSNILSMTPQGQALGAMNPQQPPNPMGMATGGDVKKKKPTVDEIKQAIFQKAQEGLSKPSEILGKHEGKYLHLTEADRAKVEKRLHGMRGGVGFSQIGLEDPAYHRRVWGVGKPGTATKLLNRQTRGLSPEDQAIWSTFIGTPEMHTSNQLVFNRMWNKFQEARASGKLSPELEQKMLEIMHSAMTKATKKAPAKAIFDPDTDFDKTHHLFNTFDRRRILANLMAGNQIGGKKGQIFDASKMIEDTTDPKLLHAPSMSVGPHLFSLTGETSYEPHLNKAFPHMLHGETSPDTFQQIPFNIAAPDFVNQIKQEKGRAPGYMDIVRRIPRQHLSEEYLTMLQKMGYKKGGKVANMDTMRLELSRKTKKA